MSRIRNILALLRGQLWIIPLAISILALALAYGILTYGASLFEPLTPEEADLWWLYSGDADSARGLLSSLLSGLMTMTSLIVSVTFVILTLAANQLGPRLISTFMEDRQIQTVLGLFLGTILYVLVVLRSLDDTLGSKGVPHIAVSVGSAFTVICLLALLFYVHKIARSIIADNIVALVAGSLESNIREMLSDEEHDADEIRQSIERPWTGAISLDKSGYIQVIGYGALIEAACRASAVLEVKVRAGHFVLKYGEHVIVHGQAPLEDEAADAIRAAFVIDQQRSPAQDLEYGIRQLVEIGLRALSPGINDTFTAIAVIDRLGAALEEVLVRSQQPHILRDDDGVVRVVADRSDIQGLVDAAFDAIRQAGRDMPSVLIRAADILGQLAPVIRSEEGRDAVLSQLDKLAETARQAQLTPSDKTSTLSRIAKARAGILSRSVEAGSCRIKSADA